MKLIQFLGLFGCLVLYLKAIQFIVFGSVVSYFMCVDGVGFVNLSCCKLPYYL